MDVLPLPVYSIWGMIHFQTFGSPLNRPLIIIHGLFGSSKNWMSQSKLLSSDYFVVSVDCRNHGSSFHSDSMTYSDMAKDIIVVMDNLHLNTSCLIGHSMGGKVAMTTALLYPERVSQQIILDIAPKSYPSHHHQILKAMNALNLSQYKSRTEVANDLFKDIPNISLCQFLVKNISVSSPLKWCINLSTINRCYASIIDWDFKNNPLSMNIPTKVIYGTKSDYVSKNDQRLFNSYFQNTDMDSVHASHWLHAEKPELVLNLIRRFIFDD